MSYDLNEFTVRDRIRGRLGDTSNDVSTENFPDVTYDAVIAATTNEWYATAEMGKRRLRQLNDEVKSYGDTGIFNVTFRDPSDLENRIAEWTALGDAEDAGQQGTPPNLVTIEADIFFEGSDW